MTNRKNWPCALSVGYGAMNAVEFEKLAKAGIGQLEFSCGDLNGYRNGDFVNSIAEFASEAKKNGTEISSVHLPFYPAGDVDPTNPDAGTRLKTAAFQSEYVKAAADAGVKFAIIHPSCEPYREEEREERLSCAIDTIGRVTESAKAAGITLALENLPRTCLCRTSDEMQKFLEAIPDLRVVFDTNHSLKEDNIHYIKAVGGKIVTLHVSDYDFIDERHQLPGEGKNDWEGIISALEEVGYCGRFLYELKAGYSYDQVAGNYKSLIK